VAIIVLPAFHSGLLADFAPRRLERRDWACRVFRQRLPEGEHKPFWPALSESPDIPGGMCLEYGDRRFVQWDRVVRQSLFFPQGKSYPEVFSSQE